MRRILLKIFLVLSLALGGAASAWAAQDCPYLTTAAGVHDCCPDGMNGSMQDTRSHHGPTKKAADCQLGQACRASNAVSPSLPALQSRLMVVEAAPVVFRNAVHETAKVNAFWRPPRVI